jgi:hypothetical protein
LLISPATTLLAQSPGQLYALGVNMGIASYQISAVRDGTNLPYVKAAWNETAASVYAASNTKNAIDTSAGGLFLSGSYNLEKLATNLVEYANQGHDFAEYKQQGLKGVNTIESLRTGYSKQLTSRGIPTLLQAYLLGVNLGIAEGQATSNNDWARTIIAKSLDNATGQAIALGLDPRPLRQCRDYIFAANPNGQMNNRYSYSLDEIHGRIISLRSYHQGLLNQ